MCEGSIKPGKRVKCINPGMFSGLIGEVINVNSYGVLVKFPGINHQLRLHPIYLEVVS